MKCFLSKIVTVWVQVRDLYLFLFRRALILNSYVDDHTWRGIRHRNWGDDLNYYFVKLMTGRPVVFYHNFKIAHWLRLKNYLCIGTLLDGLNYKNAQTIVWGSGCSGAKRALSVPKSVMSVRGRLTRDYLFEQGVDCPEVYGDPALLLPMFYKPVVQKKHKMGVIPHVIDYKHHVVEAIRAQCPDVLIIDLAHYDKWTDVIDQICSCEMIASSSLHGLIVSDAYGIPNCWIELGGKLSGGYFKFKDYGTSVGRQLEKPLVLDDVNKLNLLKSDITKWAPPVFNAHAILVACPLPISKKVVAV